MPSPTKLARSLALVAAMTLSVAATTARADDDETPPDARLEGFQKDSGKGPLSLGTGGTTTTWFLAVILGGLCFGVMSKNAKRTHLD